jgi:hypothetical protein
MTGILNSFDLDLDLCLPDRIETGLQGLGFLCGIAEGSQKSRCIHANAKREGRFRPLG